MDSRITWDDAGATAGALIFASAIMAAVRRHSWWLIGLLTGLPVLIFNVVKYGRYEAVLGVAGSVFGAALGAAAGRAAERYRATDDPP